MPKTRTKRCPRCGQVKPFAEYWKNRSTRDGLRTYCTPCDRITNKRSRDPKKWRDYMRNRREDNKKRLRGFLLSSRGCVVCGIRDPEVLDFHHVKAKRWEVSKMRAHAWATVLGEIAKCEILCANCHRRQTARDNWWW